MTKEQNEKDTKEFLETVEHLTEVTDDMRMLMERYSEICQNNRQVND